MKDITDQSALARWRRAGGGVLTSMLVYLFLGPLAALLIVALLVIHEFGHYTALQRLGYRPVALLLYPLRGGAVRVAGIDEWSGHSSVVALWGPLAAITTIQWMLLVGHVSWWTLPVRWSIDVACCVALMQNVLNLIPFTRSDGARILAVLPRRGWLLLLPLLTLSVLAGEHVHPRGAFIVTACTAVLAGGWATWLRWRQPLAPPRVVLPGHGRTIVAGTYAVLLFISIAELLSLILVLPLGAFMPRWGI